MPEYHITYGLFKKTLIIEDNGTFNDLLTAVKELFKITCDTKNLLLQFFEKKYDDWIDIKDEELPQHESKLKVTLRVVDTFVNVCEILTETTEGSHDDTILDSTISTSSAALGKPVFPLVYTVPKFAADIEELIEEKNEMVLMRKYRNRIINTLYEDLSRYTKYPTHDQYQETVKRLVLKHKFLSDRQENGDFHTIPKSYTTWWQSLKNKFKHQRMPLTSDPEVAKAKSAHGTLAKVALAKRKATDSTDQIGNAVSISSTSNASVPKRIKRGNSKSGDFGGEDEKSIKGHINILQKEWAKAKPDHVLIDEKMSVTLIYRENLVQDENVPISQIFVEFPTFHCEKQIFKEIQRRTTLCSDVEKLVYHFAELHHEKILSFINKKPKRKSFIHKVEMASEAMNDERIKQIRTTAALVGLPFLFNEELEDWISDKDDPKPEPLVRVMGDSFFSKPTEVTIGQDKISCSTIENAITTSFCCYYIFNLQYEQSLKKTLAFFQMVILKIDQEKKLRSSFQSILNYLSAKV